MMTSKYAFGISMICLLLISCSDRKIADLETYVNHIKTRSNPSVEPLPVFKHVPSYFYTVEHLNNPFAIPEQTIHVKFSPKPDSNTTACSLPETLNPYRVRTDLERIPLDALEMVGTLTDGNDNVWALVKEQSTGTVYRVQYGDYIGQHYGKVIAINDDKVEIIELIEDKSSCWRERITALSLIS
ncbi:MAG: pilus assembly protein PilP [Pseudomonadota bacterium]|nr:pilus assembly protein PilP [Pseudomonadota bacterium]